MPSFVFHALLKTKKGNFMFFLAALIVLVLDQWTKFLAVAKLPHGASREVIHDFLNFTLIYNPGAAFGIFKGATVLLICIALVAILAILFFYRNNSSSNKLYIVSLGLIFGGAISNLVDRLRFAKVIDFIDFRVFPVFNLADTSITLGVIVMGYLMLVKKK